ncbi:MAG: hypothetical protein ACXVHV_11700, partial [Methanobacterium sp.]
LTGILSNSRTFLFEKSNKRCINFGKKGTDFTTSFSNASANASAATGSTLPNTMPGFKSTTCGLTILNFPRAKGFGPNVACAFVATNNVRRCLSFLHQLNFFINSI